MIDKQPDFLKTQILTVIRENFPLGKNPLVAGFGNKMTDAKSYRNSGIKLDKIFIIG
jgi:phosphatidate phosphatase PAH1